VPKVAVIQDGTEIARQRFADVTASFARCGDLLGGEPYLDFTLQTFTDEQVDFLLDGIDRREWSCLVFASNALRSSEVVQAIERHRDGLFRYIGSGGGIVLLHQIIDSLDPVLPSQFVPTIRDRTVPSGAGRAEMCSPTADVLLNFPVPVVWQTLRDLEQAELTALRSRARTSELGSLFFKVLERDTLPSTLRPVLAGGHNEIILARSEDHVPENIVICAMPLDWQGSRPHQADGTTALLANAIRFASCGTPRRLVWRDPSNDRNELIRRWLCIDGAGVVRTAPAEDEPVSDVDSWLLSAVDVLALPPQHLEAFLVRKEIDSYLASGGTLLSVESDERIAASRITALVGRREERELSSRLYAELRAVPGWQTVESAFRIRNIVAALSLLWEDDTNRRNPAAMAPSDLTALPTQVADHLTAPQHREDFGSSLALAQTLAFLQVRQPADPSLVDWMESEGSSREFDIALQTSATLAFARRLGDCPLLSKAMEAIRDGPRPLLPPLIRIMDAIALLHQAGLLARDTDSAASLASMVCDVLDTVEAPPQRGWISVEATADLTRGMVALCEHVDPNRSDVLSRLAGHVARGATALKLAYPRYEANPEGVGWLARITHALIVAERRFPVGLQNLASIQWPEQSESKDGARISRALLEHLALENERLRLEGQRREALLEQKEGQLRDDALAARFGRVTVTGVATATLCLAAWAVLRAIGWTSITGILSNIAVLVSAVLALLAGVYTLLDRWHLLALPAATARAWIDTHALPIVSAAGNLKRE
jgi:hypothetical protein